MKKLLLFISGLTISAIGFSQAQTFAFTGAQQIYTVPNGACKVTIECRGARGANSSTSQGANGGTVTAEMNVIPGQQLFVYVGGMNGYNGGGAGHSGGGNGGGATDVRVGGTTLNDRVIVAGGGGGAGATNPNAPGGTGGGGTVGSNYAGGGGGIGANLQGPPVGGANGGLNGGAGGVGNGGNNGGAGGGGGLNSGGAFGVNSGFANGNAGTLGVGGAGGGSTGPGGGGGGYYGGGGASGGQNSNAGGGGGSSWSGTLANPVFTAGNNAADGLVIITVIANGNVTVMGGNDTTVCAGQPLTLTGSGNASTYTWNHGVSDGVQFNADSTRNYIVTGTGAGGCQATDTVTVTVNQLPNVLMAAAQDTVCVQSGPIVLTGTPSGGTFSGSGVSGTNFNPGTAGTGNHEIVYTYTDGNGCSNSDTVNIEVEPCVGINDYVFNDKVSMFPVPFKDQFTIRVEGATGSEQYELIVFNTVGQVVLQEQVRSNQTIDSRSLDVGMYTIKLLEKNKVLSVGKVVKH